MMQTLPVSFTLTEFRKAMPHDWSNIWNVLLDRNAEKISVRRRGTALKNLEKIFIATFRLANTVGFSAMTLRDLCRETGLSMGGLYSYIDSKDQLATMIEDLERHFIEEMQTWFSHVESPVDQAECLIRASIFLGAIFEPWAYFVFMESRTLAVEQRHLAKESELRFHSCLATLIEATGGFSAKEAFLLAAHCVDFVEGWYVKRWKYFSAKIEVDEFADSAVKLLRSHVGIRQAVNP